MWLFGSSPPSNFALVGIPNQTYARAQVGSERTIDVLLVSPVRSSEPLGAVSFPVTSSERLGSIRSTSLLQTSVAYLCIRASSREGRTKC
jgi:hypothetical protein